MMTRGYHHSWKPPFMETPSWRVIWDFPAIFSHPHWRSRRPAGRRFFRSPGGSAAAARGGIGVLGVNGRSRGWGAAGWMGLYPWVYWKISIETSKNHSVSAFSVFL